MRPFPSVGESLEAARLGVEWNTRLRQEAALLVVCADCEGALLATVTWVNGRPLAGCQEQGDLHNADRRTRRYWDCSWADRGPWLHARAGKHRHMIDLGDVQACLPAPGRPRKKMKVRHTEHRAVFDAGAPVIVARPD